MGLEALDYRRFDGTDDGDVVLWDWGGERCEIVKFFYLIFSFFLLE